MQRRSRGPLRDVLGHQPLCSLCVNRFFLGFLGLLRDATNRVGLSLILLGNPFRIAPSDTFLPAIVAFFFFAPTRNLLVSRVSSPSSTPDCDRRDRNDSLALSLALLLLKIVVPQHWIDSQIRCFCQYKPFSLLSARVNDGSLAFGVFSDFLSDLPEVVIYSLVEDAVHL